MKMMIVALIALLSVTNVSAREKVKTLQPQIQMYAHLNGLYFVNYDRVCVDGDMLRTKNPMKLCVKLKKRFGKVVRQHGDRGAKVCEVYENKFLATSIAYERNFCTDWQRKSNGEKKCQNWEKQTRYYPLDFKKEEALFRYNRSQKKWRKSRILNVEELSVPTCD